MSEVRLHAHVDERPPMSAVLGVLDNEARRTSREAGDEGLSAVRRILPARSHRLERATRRRVSRTAVGYRIDISPGKTPLYPSGVSPREVWRFVGEGTGVRGKRGRPIRPRHGHAFRLPNGWAGETQGQAPQHLTERARTAADARVERRLERGAHDAARAMEEALSL